MLFRRRPPAIEPGQVRRASVLGTEATYEVLQERDDLCQVAVLNAPGLAAGTELWLRAEAVRNMPCARHGKQRVGLRAGRRAA